MSRPGTPVLDPEEDHVEPLQGSIEEEKQQEPQRAGSEPPEKLDQAPGSPQAPAPPPLDVVQRIMARHVVPTDEELSLLVAHFQLYRPSGPSSVWENFRLSKAPEKAGLAVCLHCLHWISVKSNTSNALRHIKRCTVARATESVLEYVSHTKMDKTTLSRRIQSAADDLLLKFITTGCLPLSLCENKTFWEFCRFLCPGYQPPSRRKLYTDLEIYRTHIQTKVRADSV